jgi:hypothetical protein
MSLEDKIINPMVPADLPGQRSDPLPKAGKKRRKSGGTTGVALGKAKKSDLEDEVGGDTTAVLTLGASDEARRPQKKMLFESASDGATLAFAGPAIRRETPKPAPVAPAAAAPAAPAAKAPKPVAAEPVAAPVAATPAAEVAEVKVIAPSAKPAAEKDAAALAAMKSSVFQVAALAKREDEAPTAQAELALTVEPAADDVVETSNEAVAIIATATVADAKHEESVDESLTLAFDATLADGLAERTAATDEEIAPEPATPVGPPPVAPEPIAFKTPEPATIETASPTKPAAVAPEPIELKTPEPAIIETARPAAPTAIEPPPAPAYVAPIVAAPNAEPKPESETPNRGLSRSEAIARAARMSVRTTARPVQTAAETLAAARTAQQQLRSADLPKNPGDIYGYWTRAKNGRRFPSRADFDAEQVAENWPNSMLLTCGNGNGAGSSGNFSSVLRLGANRRTRPGEDLNFTSMITEWILATGGEAARAGTPVQDTEVFPTPDGTHAYKIVALPLSENQTRVDHVLCHLSRS